MKKIMILITLILTSFSFISCGKTTITTLFPTTIEAIEVQVNTNDITITEGNDYQLVVTSNDPVGLTYSVDKAGIITLSDTGYISAITEGNVVVKVTSRSDTSVYQEVQVTVRKEIQIISNQTTISMKEGDTHQLVITSNDDYTFEASNTEILVVSETGLITAKSEGSTDIIVTSTYDTTVSITIHVNVAKLITIDVEKDDYVLVVGDTESLAVSSNDGLTYQSGNTGIVTVNESGVLTAVGFGETTVRITSSYDTSVQEDVTVMVYKYTETLSITGSDLLIKGMSQSLSVDVSPVGAYEQVTWDSSDETILTVDEFGVVTAVAAGSATIIAKSTLDETIADTFNITVVNVLIVDSTKTLGDTYTYETLELEYGVQLFATISDALSHSSVDTFIYVESGTYSDDLILDLEGISIIGLSDSAVITGSIDVRAANISLKELVFEGNANITNTVAITNFTFEQNTVQNITSSETNFLNLVDVTNASILSNTFTTLSHNAISLVDFKGSLTAVKQNQIDGCETAIIVDAETTLAATDEIRIFWNTISNVALAFSIDMDVAGVEQEVYKVARFNQVTAFTQAALVNSGSTFDLTLNYWGGSDLDLNQFANVDPYYLKGDYQEAVLMPSESTYNPTLPIIITVTNPIDEIMIGETYTFEYEILPYELSNASVKFITGNPDIIVINQSGMITPISSGSVYIQVRSSQVSTIRTQVDFSVITTPGVEITTSNIYSNITVGDSFTLGTLLFPYTIENETATITSNAPMVADIDSAGVVSTYGEGLVTFRATLDSDPNVYVDYTIYVHGLMDPDNNLLDYLTTQQVSYSTIHEWTAYGFQYNYYDTRAESVSRYYFGDVTINDSKIVPVTYGIRPGEPMDPLPEGVTGYNAYDVYWIVIHDTASTALGSTALAHANYLYNNAIAGNELWVSWHFTIDDTYVYQHLPEIERGYHAGDGSTQPTLGGTYLGGGNRNGIGIEMCVNEDGDMYRTWQRTAKLVAYLLEKYNLPVENQKYHNDFSGKDCPNTLRNAGLVSLFEEFVASEYYVRTSYPNATITFTSNNPDYLDNYGRIIQIPQRAMTVSYTITVTDNGVTESRTFYTYIPGTVR